MSFWDFLKYQYWCFLPKDVRYVGFASTWYDGPIYSFGFWWFHVYSLGYNPDKTTRAFCAGIDAFKAGKSLEDCPFREGQYRATWIGGWNVAEETHRKEKRSEIT